ncbi:hypothetical protein FN846DRAFT_960321, partial [Sphaerosporella brunnea]
MIFATINLALVFAIVFAYVGAEQYLRHTTPFVPTIWRQPLNKLTCTTGPATTEAPLISVPGFELPPPTDLPNSIYHSVLWTIVVLAVAAIIYVTAVYFWRWLSKLRWRWKLGSEYEHELRESRVEVGESAGWSDVGSMERAVHYVDRRAGLWWRSEYAESPTGRTSTSQDSIGRASAVSDGGSARERGSMRSGSF